MAREYKDTLTVNLDQLVKMERAQRNIYDRGFVSPSKVDLTSLLGLSATVLGLVFIASTPVSVATAAVSLGTSFVPPSEKKLLEGMVKTGYWDLGYARDLLADGYYDLLEMELPFIEYVVNGQKLRLISGKNAVKRAHIKGSSWVTIN